MRLQITADTLSGALAMVRPAIGRSPIPSLEMVLFDARAAPDGGLGQLVVDGGSLEMRARRSVACQVFEPGAVCVPPAIVADFLAVTPADSLIDLVADETTHKVRLRAGRTQVQAPGLAGDLFPLPPSFESPNADLTLSAPLFGICSRRQTSGAEWRGAGDRAERLKEVVATLTSRREE